MGVDGYNMHGEMNNFEYVNGCLIHEPVQFKCLAVWMCMAYIYMKVVHLLFCTLTTMANEGKDIRASW